MRIGLIGRAAAQASMGLLLAMALAACTTVEGTNAMTDVGTFEREVLTSNARGFGLIGAEAPKEDITQARAPLVLPRGNGTLPQPTQAVAGTQLPVNSDSVRIDTANLSEDDIARLRNARVMDARTLSGRPLTAEETRALTARMQANNTQVTVNGQRPLYLPPDEYFTRVGDADMVCRNPAGQIVPLSDASCPAEVRREMTNRTRAFNFSGNGLDSQLPD